MAKIIQFNPIQYFNIPTEPINPNEVTLMTCDYDRNLNPVLIISTFYSDYTVKLGKPTKYSDFQQKIVPSLADALMLFLQENNLISKKANLKGDYRLGCFTVEIAKAWDTLRIQQYINSFGKYFELDTINKLLGYPQKRTLCKFVDEQHIEELHSLLKSIRSEGWIWNKLESKHMEVAASL